MRYTLSAGRPYALLGAALVMAACSDSTAPAARTAPSKDVQLAVLEGTNPEFRILAEEMGAAMKDPRFRGMVARLLRASKLEEGRIVIDELLAQPEAAAMKERVEKRRGARPSLAYTNCSTQRIPTEECADYGGSTPQKVTYIPIDEQRAAYDGTQYTYTVTAPTNDSSATIAYGTDSYGEPIWVSMTTPPDVITFVIDYDEAQVETPTPAPGTLVQMRGRNVEEYITHMKTTNDHEPWIKGKPEFRLHLAGLRSGELEYKLTRDIRKGMWSWRDGANNDWRSAGAHIPLGIWDTDLGRRIKVTCYERDPTFLADVTLSVKGTTTKTVAGVKTEVPFSIDFKRDPMDDYCGETYLTLFDTADNWLAIPSGPTFPNFMDTGDLQWYGVGVQR